MRILKSLGRFARWVYRSSQPIPEVAAMQAYQRQAKAGRRHRRVMTVAGAAAGGLVAGPAGALALGVAENALNQGTPKVLTAAEQLEAITKGWGTDA